VTDASTPSELTQRKLEILRFAQNFEGGHDHGTAQIAVMVWALLDLAGLRHGQQPKSVLIPPFNPTCGHCQHLHHIKFTLTTSKLTAPTPGASYAHTEAYRWSIIMRSRAILLAFTLVLAGCKPENAHVDVRPVRTIVVDPKPVLDGRQAVGEVKPRYESDLSFRVTGKLVARRVDVGAMVKQGDTLASLDVVDYQNRLRSAEADVSASEAALVESQSTEARLGKLLKSGWTPQASYDVALRNLRSAEAKLAAARAALDLTRDQLNYTVLKADFDGVITSVGAETGQNVSAGQTVVKLAQLTDKDAVFNIAETALVDHRTEGEEVIVWPLSNPQLTIEGVVREVAPVADSTTRTYTVKVTLKDTPSSILFGMSIGGRWKGNSALVVTLPLSVLFEKDGAPAVWVFDQQSGSAALKPVIVARYEADTVIIASGLAKGDMVVTAGINSLREGQKVRLADAAASGRIDQ
jgi:RND family efflux transporter MFP subunit